MPEVFVKDPNAVLDYWVDWTDWMAEGDTINTSEWIVATGITKNADTKDLTMTAIWLSGGTAGTDYQVTNRITTLDGRTDDRTITIQVGGR